MSETWVLNSSDRQRIYNVLEKGYGAKAEIFRMIISGDYHGKIDSVEWYDAEEHSSDDVTEDVAIEIASQLDSSESVHPDLFDFIEDTAGQQYTRGLRRAELTFAAE